MPEVDAAARRIGLKLVYYGPALSGKTTNLTRLHDLVAPELKGEMMALETQGDRTLFFDLLPLGFRAPSGWLVKLKLYTVPGQVAHDGTRKAVLSRADGVVFVADSQLNQAVNNAESLENLAGNAHRVGLDFATLPLVVQFNKRDLADIVTEAEVRKRFAATGWPLVFASALEGRGVVETLECLLDRVYEALDGPLGLAAEHRVGAAEFRRALLGGAAHVA